MNTATKLPTPKESRVKPVSGFQTTDGQMFNVRADAERHQNRLDFFTWMLAKFSHLGDQQQAMSIAEEIWGAFTITPRED